MRWIGVDYGAVRVGIAVTDESGQFVMPYDTVAAAEAAVVVVDLAEELGAGVVVGWPLELSGQAGRAAARVQQFVDAVEQLAAERGFQVALHKRDERLTTGLAQTLLDDAGVFGQKRKGVVDQVAAVQILEGFLVERGRGEEG